ncbi:hypothetical protein MtrunA17_Chr7g0261711 [Medicago truncatula]|uniref:Transmembrane protein n=1 Tax=Medicago truncatula TaxID=3880 RepID=A0A396HAI7_MEDTR|nr:hypothetical protein MtrunA17_Chr7g0261711 [Medicago truncatula]
MVRQICSYLFTERRIEKRNDGHVFLRVGILLWSAFAYSRNILR